MRIHTACAAGAAVLLAGLLFTTRPALAGPPAICHAVDIGDAESLPWGSDSFDKKRGYRLRALVDDTVKVLDGSKSALVHMETLRRAALYSNRDDQIALRLMARLMARALDAQASGTPNALAWFDAGYLAQCFDQLRSKLELKCGSAQGVVGYGWVRKALALQPDDPELEFGAAMVTSLAGIPEHDQHVANVKALAADDSLVKNNLVEHATRYWPRHRARG